MDHFKTRTRSALDALPVTISRMLVRPAHQPQQYSTPLLVVGSGAAGLAAALYAADYTDVLLITRDGMPASNSARAQGGIAAAIASSDSPVAHLKDTLTAGAGLSDVLPTTMLTTDAPLLMHHLATLGVPFEPAYDALHSSRFALGLEGGHSHRRILHSGDTTGWAITSTLMERACAHPRLRMLEGLHAVELLTSRGGMGTNERCTGVLALDQQGTWHQITAGATILATGGAGAIYGFTSNQSGALGEGIALAYRAGAALADMEFVQFHPTVFRTRTNQGFLISEAVRGEGALLLTPDGQRFMPDFHPLAELAPRDVVARAIFQTMQANNSDFMWLDVRHLSAAYLEQRFPSIVQHCRAEGIDPASQPVPVAPAAHYLMGGICTDTNAATSLPGLYAAGECACTGVHGANRLASNSLLECLVFGQRAAAAALTDQPPTLTPGSNQTRLTYTPQQASAWEASEMTNNWQEQLALVMQRHVGVVRSADSLTAALDMLATFPTRLNAAQSASHTQISAANAALVCRLIATSALLRTESRGGHHRSDFPQEHESWRKHIVHRRGIAPFLSAHIADGVSSGAVVHSLSAADLTMLCQAQSGNPALSGS